MLRLLGLVDADREDVEVLTGSELRVLQRVDEPVVQDRAARERAAVVAEVEHDRALARDEIPQLDRLAVIESTNVWSKSANWPSLSAIIAFSETTGATAPRWADIGRGRSPPSASQERGCEGYCVVWVHFFSSHGSRIASSMLLRFPSPIAWSHRGLRLSLELGTLDGRRAFDASRLAGATTTSAKM